MAKKKVQKKKTASNTSKATKKAAVKKTVKASKKSKSPKSKSESRLAKRGTVKVQHSRPSKVVGLIKNAVASVEDLFGLRPNDVVSAIKMDHDGLRNYLADLKDTDQEMHLRRRAYERFADLLKSHTEAEEKTAYKTSLSIPGREMHIKTAEGYVEHQLAEDLMKRIEKTKDALAWSAHANVLAEIVEHHLREEERDLLPELRKATTPEQDNEMLVKYLELRAETQKIVSSKSAGSLETIR